MKKIIILFIAVSFMVGCDVDATADAIANDNCHFLQNLEEVNKLITECNENEFTSTSEIENNLIGEWSLSGVLNGWHDFVPTSECLLLSIANESLTLKNLNTGEESSSDWKLISYEVNDYQVFYLEPNDQALRWLVGMQSFSKDIMYGAGLADDTFTYVYEKRR